MILGVAAPLISGTSFLLINPHLIQAPLLDLVDAVDHQRWDHGRRDRDVVRKRSLDTRAMPSGSTTMLKASRECDV